MLMHEEEGSVGGESWLGGVHDDDEEGAGAYEHVVVALAERRISPPHADATTSPASIPFSDSSSAPVLVPFPVPVLADGLRAPRSLFDLGSEPEPVAPISAPSLAPTPAPVPAATVALLAASPLAAVSASAAAIDMIQDRCARAYGYGWVYVRSQRARHGKRAAYARKVVIPPSCPFSLRCPTLTTPSIPPHTYPNTTLQSCRVPRPRAHMGEALRLGRRARLNLAGAGGHQGGVTAEVS